MQIARVVSSTRSCLTVRSRPVTTRRVSTTTRASPRQVVSTDQAPGAVGPYSQAIKAGGMVYVSGQVVRVGLGGLLALGLVGAHTRSVTRWLAHTLFPLSLPPFLQALVPGTKDFAAQDVGGQTEQVMKNLEAILQAAGSDFSKVVKCTILLADMADFAEVNAIYGSRFPENPPARATFAVKGLPLGALVELDAVAME